MSEAELKVLITAEISKLKQELNKGKKETENFNLQGVTFSLFITII